MLRIVLASLLLLLGSAYAQAQRYPEKPVLLIAPFAAGTTADVGGRIIAESLSKRLGQRVVVENVPAAMGQLGVERMLSAGADGYTFCYCNDGAAVTVPAAELAVGKKPPYLPEQFAAIGRVVEIRFMLAVNASVPVQNLSQLLGYARAQPKGLTMGAPSPMAAIVTGLLKRVLGEAIVETRYARGEPQAITELINGSIHVMVASVNTLLPQAEAGKIRIIGAIGGRNPFVPDVPALSEQQSAETAEFVRLTEQLMPWNGLLGPKGLPGEVVQTLSTALKATLADPDVVRALTNARLVIRYSSPEEFTSLINSRLPAVTKILRDSQIRLR